MHPIQRALRLLPKSYFLSPSLAPVRVLTGVKENIMDLSLLQALEEQETLFFARIKAFSFFQLLA
jgi:hypothetical protein